MGKYGKYKRTYVREWESKPEFKGWLRKATDEQSNDNDLKEAYCSICECVLRAHHGDLIQHAKTTKHITKRNSFLQPKLNSFGIHSDSFESKKNDIKLSVHIAAHSAINSIDHLGEILNTAGKGSIFEKTRLHRTKCSKIILNVVSPTLLEDIFEDIGENRYSLIVDESTDVSITKYMAYCVRYYSKSLKSITTEFLGLVMIERATAIDLRDGTLEFLKTIKLKPERIIGLGVDGASNLCGRNNSLYTLLKEISPKLQLIKCICHSLNSCSSKAAEILPAHIEYMLRESVSWFSHSTLRKIEYSRLYQTINGDGSTQKQLVKLCATRWLAFYNCIKVVVDQWLELQTCFKLASTSKKEKCHTARTLAEMYNDENLLYFVFLKPILREITNVNLQFQANNADHTKTYGELKMLLLSIAKRIIKPIFLRDDECPGVLCTEDVMRVHKALENPLAFLPLEAIDYGHSFEILAQKNTISKNNLKLIKERCLHYMTSLCRELVKRLPSNTLIIEKLKYFSPLVVLSSVPPKFSDLPIELAEHNVNIETLEIQWRKLITLKYNDICSPNITIEEKDTSQFWVDVLNITNNNKEQIFHELGIFVLNLLSLPLSNAVVERVFSVMNAVKSKARNRMHMAMLEAIMRIRLHLNSHKICCTKFDPTANIIKRFNAKMYEKKIYNLNDDLVTETDDSDDPLNTLNEVLQDLTNVENGQD